MISLCGGENPALLLKKQWKTVGQYLKLEDDQKLSMTHQELKEISAYKNVKGKFCSENQKQWWTLKHTEMLFEEDFGTLPWWSRWLLNRAAVRHRYVFVNESLLDANVAVNDAVKKLLKAQNHHGHTPLIEACERNKSNLARALIRLGSDVNAVDRYGNTALHWAVNYEMVEVVKILIEKGAKVDAKNNDRYTPLQWVRYSNGYSDQGKKIKQILKETEAKNANNDKN